MPAPSRPYLDRSATYEVLGVWGYGLRVRVFLPDGRTAEGWGISERAAYLVAVRNAKGDD